MSEPSAHPRLILRGLLALGLLMPALALPAAAVDLFGRSSESDVVLRDLRRLRGLQATVEIRFVTVADEFLEQVGVDFGGTVSGRVMRRGAPVDDARVILEAYEVRSDGSPAVRSVRQTGREKVATDGSGSFSIPLRRLVPPEIRQAVQAGEVDALIFEATGKNGKRMDHLRLRAETSNGGLIP